MKREMHGYLDMQIQVWSIVKVSSSQSMPYLCIEQRLSELNKCPNG
jgi:hypothetical protein